jgi:hypothetical protein
MQLHPFTGRGSAAHQHGHLRALGTVLATLLLAHCGAGSEAPADPGTNQGGGSDDGGPDGGDSDGGSDTLAPSAPTNLQVTSTTTANVTLAWGASSDNVGVASYEVYRDGTAVTQTTGTSLTDTGLAAATTYHYQVRARDAAGNVSGPSNEVMATTAAASTSGLSWAGVRSSSYGTADIGYPTPQGWTSAINTMASYFPGSSPTASIWLVGEVDYDKKGMILEFPRPNDGETYGSLYQFSSTDKHEPYFTYFDTRGIQVYPQLEPGDADIPTLIDLVLSRYQQHPSVIGLAIDAEWIHKTSDSGTETPVTDDQARAWEQKVKSYNSSYRLVLKHFEEGNLPPTYRGDIIFVCDDEQNGSLSGFLSEMKRFADHFYPSPVMFQIGYPSDKRWWSQLAKPIPQSLGLKLATQTKQQFGVLWVDFSIDDPAIDLIP